MMRRDLFTLVRRLQQAVWFAPPATIGSQQALSSATPSAFSCLPPLSIPHHTSFHASTAQRLAGHDHASEEDDVHVHVLEAAIPHVFTLGWCKAALEAGAADLGLSPAVVGSFPRGAGHLVEQFNSECNRRLKTLLREEQEALKGMPVEERLEFGVRRRLEMLIPLLETWPDALAVQAMPAEVPTALRNYGSIVDLVIRACGDTSTGVDWYAKRAVLSGIYIATEMCLLTDQSNDYQDSWNFLARQIRTFQLGQTIAGH